MGLTVRILFFVLFEKDTHTAPDPANIQAVRLSFPKLLYTCVCVCVRVCGFNPLALFSLE